MLTNDGAAHAAGPGLGWAQAVLQKEAEHRGLEWHFTWGEERYTPMDSHVGLSPTTELPHSVLCGAWFCHFTPNHLPSHIQSISASQSNFPSRPLWSSQHYGVYVVQLLAVLWFYIYLIGYIFHEVRNYFWHWGTLKTTGLKRPFSWEMKLTDSEYRVNEYYLWMYTNEAVHLCSYIQSENYINDDILRHLIWFGLFHLQISEDSSWTFF
jgi:hypothetical protein